MLVTGHRFPLEEPIVANDDAEVTVEISEPRGATEAWVPQHPSPEPDDGLGRWCLTTEPPPAATDVTDASGGRVFLERVGPRLECSEKERLGKDSHAIELPAIRDHREEPRAGSCGHDRAAARRARPVVVRTDAAFRQIHHRSAAAE